MGKGKQQNWVNKPFHNWKKAVAKMKEHSERKAFKMLAKLGLVVPQQP